VSAWQQAENQRDCAPQIHEAAMIEMDHYAWASSAAVIQIHGERPFAINYVNPADDPSKSASTAR
jgi:hypothetical protein